VGLGPVTKIKSDVRLRISRRNGVIVERYEYSRGWTLPLDPHAHDTWQVGWSPDAVGEHICRGAAHRTAPGEFSLIAPGEVHAPSQNPWVSATSRFLMLYVDHALMQAALSEDGLGGAGLGGTFRGISSGANRTLTTAVREFIRDDVDGSRLAADVSLHALLAACGQHVAEQPPAGAARREHRAVAIAREVLHGRVSGEVSLADLSTATGLSPHRLCRTFSAEVGVPPHAYQLRLRVDRARSLLARKHPTIAQVAASLGFADESHFGRCFKRVVGTTPGQYRRCVAG
jgi:AraC-like DNA-binding protein